MVACLVLEEVNNLRAIILFKRHFRTSSVKFRSCSFSQYFLPVRFIAWTDVETCASLCFVGLGIKLCTLKKYLLKYRLLRLYCIFTLQSFSMLQHSKPSAVVGGPRNQQPLQPVRFQWSRNSCSSRRVKLWEERVGRTPRCANEKGCVLGYISTGFVTAVMKRPDSCSSWRAFHL